MADTLRVTCSQCRKRSEISAPAEDYSDPTVVWVCPAPTESGDLCGHVNTVDLG